MNKKIFSSVILVVGLSLLLAISCKKDKKSISVLTTDSVSTVTQTTAISGGTISSDGGAIVQERGVCWSTTENPTINDNKTNDGTGLGLFTSSITGLTANTTYHVRAFATNSAGTAYGQDVSFTTGVYVFASISTTVASSIAITTATCGGNVASDGGFAISERGICYSTASNPTIENIKIIAAGAIDEYVCNMSGLTANTKYYIRAFATNAAGTAYGNETIFSTYKSDAITDVNGNYYNIVTIGTQKWMAENLKTTKYSNGDLIGTTDPPTKDVSRETAPKYQWAYDGNEYNVAVYGRLYTFEAAQDSRCICPAGWRVPSDDDWKILEMALGMSKTSVDSMGWRGQNHASELAGNASLWNDTTLKQNAAFGTSGFNAIPGGARRGVTNFFLKGYCAYFLSSTYYYGRSVYSADNRIYRGLYGVYGFSVRCVRN